MGTSSIKDPHVFLTYFILQHHHYTPTCSQAMRNIPANHTRHVAIDFALFRLTFVSGQIRY